MNRFLRFLSLVAVAGCLAAIAPQRAHAQGQNVAKVVNTIADLVAQDPKTLASSPPATNATFVAVVTTTGDTVAGSGSRVWRWAADSTASTNSIASGPGPFAWPYGSSTGRWLEVVAVGPTAQIATNGVQIVANMEALVSIAGASGAKPSVVYLLEYRSGSGIGNGFWGLNPSSTAQTNFAFVAVNGGGRYEPIWEGNNVNVSKFGAYGDGTTDDTAYWRAGIDYVAGKKLLWLYDSGRTNQIQPNFVVPESVNIRTEFTTRLRPTSYPSGQRSAWDYTHGLLIVTNNFTADFRGGGFDGRRDVLTYTNDRDFSMVVALQSSNVVFTDMLLDNYPEFGVYGRYLTNLVLENTRSTRGAGGSYIFTSFAPKIVNWVVDGIRMDTTVSQGVMNVVSCESPQLINPVFRNIYAGDSGNYAMTAINWWGNDNGEIVNPQCLPMALDSYNEVLPLLIDGGHHNSIRGGNIRGWNFGLSHGLEIMGGAGWTLVDGLQIEGRFFVSGEGTSDGGAGILMGAIDGIEVLDQYGPLYPPYKATTAGWQQRSQGTSHDTIIQNVTVTGYYDGMQIKGGTRGIVDNCSFSGNRVRGAYTQEINVPAFYDLAQTSKFHTPRDWVFRNSKFTFNGTDGFRYYSGNNLWWQNCEFSNNDQDNTGNHGFRTDKVSGTFGTGSSTNVLVVSGRSSADLGKVVYRYDTEEQSRITAATSTQWTISPGFATAPTNGSPWNLVFGFGGTNVFENCRFVDTQNRTFVRAGSLDPTTDISVAGTIFPISTFKAAEFHTGQRIKLKKVLTGAADLTVKYLYPDENNPDLIWVTATSPTTGTFQTATNTTGNAVIFKGTGTLNAYNYSTSQSPTASLLVTGTNTLFGAETDGHFFIKPTSREWRRISTIPSNTTIYISYPFSGSFSAGEEFLISAFDIAEVQSQNYGYVIEGTPSQFNFIGAQRTVGNAGNSANGIQGFIDRTTAPNATARLSINSASPVLQEWTTYRIANTSATTITAIDKAFDGQIYEFFFANGNTTIDFTGTTMKGYGSDQTPAAGSYGRAVFTAGNWLWSIIQP